MDIRDLTITFDGFKAVDNLNFEVYDGEIIGLLGPNGAGKTTLIKAIFGIVPYQGEIIFEGGKESIGWMPQYSPLYLNLTVEENLNYFASIYGLKEGRSERVQELLDLVELSPYRQRLTRNLSGGMKRRAMLACSMLHDPELLILDEPSEGVDPPLRRSFWRHFEEMNREGKTILVTTHYMEEAENCQRLVLMRDGVKIAEGEPDKIKKDALGGEIAYLEVKDSQKAQKVLKEENYHSTYTDGGIEVLVDDSSEALPHIIEMLNRRGVQVLRSETRKATLEEAFMKIISR